MLKMWIEAMRLRTLPVSVAGVLAGIACAIMGGTFSVVPAVLCMLFAMLAQVASNFGNEYYDYVNGLDRKGREGFRRGVTEGDISPRAMKIATYATLAVAAVVGCSMLFFGGWWLLPVGIAIGLFALAYSAGPYPLSHHGLGDVAVVVFFGIVPVTLTCYLQEDGWRLLSLSLPVSVAVGLLAANVLVVNNYRDVEDDRAVGKRTTVVIFGRKIMERCYLLSGFVAMLVMIPVWVKLSVFSLVVPATFLFLHVKTWKKIISSRGAALNPLLGATAKNLLLFTLLLLSCSLMRSFF
jgi:1,4-dihydroxy-2-naphthoate octaprenyltransferase